MHTAHTCLRVEASLPWGHRVSALEGQGGPGVKSTDSGAGLLRLEAQLLFLRCCMSSGPRAQTLCASSLQNGDKMIGYFIDWL